MVRTCPAHVPAMLLGGYLSAQQAPISPFDALVSCLLSFVD